MKLTGFIKGRKNTFVTVCIAILLVVAQIFTIAIVAAPTPNDAADTAAVEHLEKLYKDYVAKYGDKTTRAGLMRVYDSAFEINSDSFATEKAAGYSVELDTTVIRPVDGAKDADGAIVPAYNGFVNIDAVVKKDGREVGTVKLTEEIVAQTKTLTYTKSSETEAKSVWNIGLGKYLNRYTGSADKLVIPEGVEEINWDNRKTWFSGDKTSVKIIIFPSTMKKMITETLQGFTNLMAVYIPDGCTVLGANLFENCTSLRYVRLPEGVTNIPSKSFANTPALTSLHIPTTVTSVSDYAFNGSALRDIVIVADDFVGSGWDTHKNFVLTLNNNINTQVKDDVSADLTDDQGYIACRNFYYLGQNPTVNSSWLWYSCDIANGADYLWYTYIYALENNSIEDFITTQTSYSLADEYTALNTATVKRLKLQHLGQSGFVFEDADVLAHLKKLYGDYITYYGDTTTREGLLRVYDSALDINGDSFAKEKAAGFKVKLDATVLRPVDGAKDADGIIVAPRDGYANIKATVTQDGREVGTVKFTQTIPAEMKMLTYDKSSESEDSDVWQVGSGKYLNRYTGDADKIVIPEGIEEISSTSIGDWYQGDKTKVKIIVYPSTMKKIMPYTMQGFTNLMAVYIPDSCTSIGKTAFDGCTSLRYVRLSENFTEIPEECFRNTPALTMLYLPKSIKEVADKAFYGSAIRDVVITRDNFVGHGYDTHKGYVETLNNNINAQIKDDVSADLKDDRGVNVSNRHFYYLGKKYRVDSDWLWYSCDKTNGPDYLFFTLIYARKGGSIEDFIDKQTSNSLEDEYTALDTETVDLLKKQHDEYMLYGRYPKNLTTDEVQAIIDTYTFTNNGTQSEFSNFLEKALGDTGHKATVSNWYKTRAVAGCKDDDGVMFDGYNGYVAATIELTSVNNSEEMSVYGVIEPEIYEYSFVSVAQADEFYPETVDGIDGLRGDTDTEDEFFLLSQDGKILLDYFGSAEKIIIPEGVEYLDQAWWLDTDLSKVRCIILPDSLKALPDQFGVPFSATLEVVIMGDNVTVAEGKHAFWKCYRLKNLRLSERLENLNEEALFETLLLTDVKLPSALKTIEEGAFHLAAIRDIVVSESVEVIEKEAFAWPLRTLQFLEEGVRTQGNAISKELSAELNPILQEKICITSGVYIPRTITILSKDVEYDDSRSFWNTHASWLPVTVNYVADSTTQKLIESGYASGILYTYNSIDMSANEAKVTLMSALESVPVSVDSKAEDIEKLLNASVVSSELLDDLKVSNLVITAPDETTDGSVTGKVTVSTKNGGTIEVDLNRKLVYKKTFTVDMNKGGWTDKEFAYDNKFVPSITRFDDEIITEYVDVPVEVEIGKGSSNQEVVTTTTVIKRRRKKQSAEDNSMLPVIVISVAAVLVIAAGILTIILIKRKKKKAQ